MTHWRTTFGFGDEDLCFDDVHRRYREKLLETSDLEHIQALGSALEQARQELGTAPP